MPASALLRPRRRTVTTTVAAALLAGGLATSVVAPASADDTPAPIVVDDSISLYPGETGSVDVLANDSSPSGQDLALCRLPEPDYSTPTIPPVMVAHFDGSRPGQLMVFVSPTRHSDTTVDYYVCDHVHLTPATLNVHVKPVAAVEVTTTRRPGQLKVTNTNAARIVFKYGGRTSRHPDGKVPVAAGATVLVPVKRHTIVWYAGIGHGGMADRGVVRDIALPRG